eukprot:943371-Rhodomonas_salina.1
MAEGANTFVALLPLFDSSGNTAAERDADSKSAQGSTSPILHAAHAEPRGEGRRGDGRQEGRGWGGAGGRS